jgi:hypothetical protein
MPEAPHLNGLVPASSAPIF